MSAFVCHPNHIRELALFAAGLGRPLERVTQSWVRVIAGADVADLMSDAELDYPDLLATILYRENVRSVRHRYPNDSFEALERLTIGSYRRQIADPVQLLKMCQCLDYQSCETTDWEQSTAYKIIRSIISAAIGDLPGYREAAWEFTGARDAA